MFANELDSTDAQIPFDYYFLKFCPLDDHSLMKNTYENLGTVLSGESNELTPYKVV